MSSRTNTMIGAVLFETGKPLRLSELKVPELRAGQVLVDMHFSGVCRSQLMEVKGLRGPDKWLPHLLGHEGTGIVKSVGPGVSRFNPGDNVILGWIKGRGLDVGGTTFETVEDNTLINAGPVTTFNTSTIVSESRLTKLPNDMPKDLGVLFGCALPTGAGMVFNELKPRNHESVAIIGMGGIGLCSLMSAAALGVKNIIAIDVAQDRLDRARQLGARTTVLFNKRQSLQEIFDVLPDGVDACIEAAGTVESIEFGFSILNKNHGRLVFATHPKKGELIRIDPHELISGKKIHGSWGGSSDMEKLTSRVEYLFNKDLFPIEELIGKSYPLSDINQALDDLFEGITTRPLIDLRVI